MGGWCSRPKREGADAWYEFSGSGSLDRFLAGVPALKIAMASPTRELELYELPLGGELKHAA